MEGPGLYLVKRSDGITSFCLQCNDETCLVYTNLYVNLVTVSSQASNWNKRTEREKERMRQNQLTNDPI